MVVPPTKLELEAKLARCRELVREFPDGSIAAMIRDLEDELRQQIRKLESQ
jgi:hypothetical protein